MIFIDTRCILAKKTAGLYIIEFPPVGGRKKSKGLEVGKEIKGEKKRKKKKIGGKYNFWQYQMINTN